MTSLRCLLITVSLIAVSSAAPVIPPVQGGDTYEGVYAETSKFFKVEHVPNDTKTVEFDARSLKINGQRKIFMCGEIHYPRIRPEAWDDILTKARMGGLNCLQTYVFWNVHETVKGKFNFTGGNDLVGFIKKAADKGLYVILRIGPFIQAEWNHGGLPYWLREEKEIIFRTDNPSYKKAMRDWTSKIVHMMKANKLYAPHGGPIILSQIENEYDHVMAAFRKFGELYMKWAAEMALKQHTGVPWLMCKQKDAPFEVINACNGRHCADTFSGPNSPIKPKLWTENWTAQYRVFGDPPSRRGAEDISYSVARWFSMNGSHVGYYMYYGGTNYGRHAAAFVTTRYYDEAPIDEFGLPRDPKFGHLRDLHYALEMSEPGLWGAYSVQTFDADREARIYEDKKAKTCVAFLSNNNTDQDLEIQFRGRNYKMPAKSIGILPDCKTMVYNTRSIISQHSSRDFPKCEACNKNLKWEMITEPIPVLGGNFSQLPLEQFGFARDNTDYVWYLTDIELDNYDLPFRKSIQPVLDIVSLGHGIMVFVNEKFVGYNHGTKAQPKFTYRVAAQLHEGKNHLAFLQSTVGMPDSGSYMEHRFTGLRSLVIQGLGTGNLDITKGGWHHKMGLKGERMKYFSEDGSKKIKWEPLRKKTTPMTWYKSRFDAPGLGSLAINVTGMTKGMVWVNGHSIGRYWSSYSSPLGQPSQEVYHIPRSFLKPTDNLLVIFDELGGKISEVEILTANRDTICSWISESYPAHVSSWKWDHNELKPKGDLRPKSILQCPQKDQVVQHVQFASFGDPWGTCGLYEVKACSAKRSMDIVKDMCLGKNYCEIPLDRNLFHKDGGDPCPNVKDKILAVQLKCGLKK